MKKNKRAINERLIALIVVLIALVLGVILLIRLNGFDTLKIVIPGFPNIPWGINVKYSEKCPEKIGLIGTEGYLKECKNAICNSYEDSKIKFKGDDLYVIKEGVFNKDIKIGAVSNNKLVIYPELVQREGETYNKVSAEIFSFYYFLLNLNDAYFYSKTEICRDSRIEDSNLNTMEKIGTLVFFEEKERIFIDNGEYRVAEDADSGLYFEGNLLMADKINIGLRKEGLIIIYPNYKDPTTYSEEIPDVAHWFIIKLENSRIIDKDIYVKRVGDIILTT